MSSGTPAWGQPLTVAELDAAERRRRELEGCCDFCAVETSGDGWLYPTRRFARHPGNDQDLADVLTRRGVRVTISDSGGWFACPPCHRLLVSGRREQLARRMAKHGARRFGGSVASHLPRCRHVIALVWRNREGPPERSS